MHFRKVENLKELKIISIFLLFTLTFLRKMIADNETTLGDFLTICISCECAICWQRFPQETKRNDFTDVFLLCTIQTT